jgi:hypothetical protein
VKISVKDKAKEEESMEQEEEKVEYRSNHYLYDASGPRRRINYSKPDGMDD